MGIEEPVVTPAKVPGGIWRIAATIMFAAGTAGTEYHVPVGCVLKGNPKLSSNRKLAKEFAPVSSDMQDNAKRNGKVEGMLWARLAVPGSPGSDPHAVRFSESKAVLKGVLRGTGSGFTWQNGS